MSKKIVIHEGIFPSEKYQYGTDKNIPLSTFTDWKEGILECHPVNKEETVNRWRLIGIVLITLITVLVLVGRLFSLQIIRGNTYFVLSERNRIYSRVIPAERGVIYDRNGVVLARNDEVNSLAMVYAEIPSESSDQITDDIQLMFSLDATEFQDSLTVAKNAPQTPIVIKHKVSYDEQLAFEVKKEQLSGFYFIKETIRKYPAGSNFSTVLGYMGEVTGSEIAENPDKNYPAGSLIGKDGVEKSYENELSGTSGRAFAEIDAQNKVLEEIIAEKPKTGTSLKLTIDSQVQNKISELLAGAIEKYQATGGSVVVMNPTNGEIYGLVSLPTYDNNIFFNDPKEVGATLTDPRGLLLNRAISGLYAPGSTVKMAIGSEAISEGLITAKTQISSDPQVIIVGGWQFPDWTYSWGRAPYGMLTFAKALSVSSDTFFYKVGGGYPAECVEDSQSCEVKGLGSTGLEKALRKFGLGDAVGIDLPNEAKGLVPNPDWKESVRGEAWFLGNTYHLSIGQGDLLATPIQILNLTNTIATDKQTPTPHVVVDGHDVLYKDKPVSIDIIRVAREGMALAVSEGIVYPLREAPVKVAAKTGTAEFGSLNAKGEYATHAWVTGFASIEQPQISFVFMLESGGGSTNAAQLAEDFVKWYFTQYQNNGTIQPTVTKAP